MINEQAHDVEKSGEPADDKDDMECFDYVEIHGVKIGERTKNKEQRAKTFVRGRHVRADNRKIRICKSDLFVP